MIRYELSIRASEVEKSTTNLNNNKLRTIQTNIAKNISHVKELVAFNSKKNEDRIFAELMQHLEESVNLLKEINPHLADLNYYKNYRKEDLLAWSFVEIDRQNPDQSKVKAMIANHRYKLVQIDNAIEQATFDVKAFDTQFNDRINYLLKYDELKQACYHENDARLEHQSFTDFYNNLRADYQKKFDAFYKKFPAFYGTLVEIINECYEQVTRGVKKDDALLLSRDIIKSCNELLEFNKRYLEADVELSILREQRREKLPVTKDIERVEKRLKVISDFIKKTQKEIKEKEHILEVLSDELTNPVSISLDLKGKFDDNQLALIEKIKTIFVDSKINRSRALFEAIRDYIYINVPLFSTLFEQEYAKYVDEVIEYRNKVAETLEPKVAKLYANEDKYIDYISHFDAAAIKAKVKEVNIEFDKKIKEAKEWYKAQVVILKENKQKRIEEYKTQKKNVAIALKVADAKKASDLKEVVKLYKKEINQGEGARYAELAKALNAKISEINSLRRIALSHATSSAPTSYAYEHRLVEKAQNSTINKERGKLKAHLRKELSISKYRKDMNVEKRELLLGYFFLAIWGIGFLLFTLVPILYTVLMCFSDISYTAAAGYSKVIAFSFKDGITFPSWTGKTNFEALFLSDVNFVYRYIPSFFRNLLLYVPIVVFIAFVLALLLNTKIKGRTLFRIIYFLPVVIVSGPVLTMLNGTDNNQTSNITISLSGTSVATILQSLSPKVLEYANEVFSNFIIILWMTGVPIVLFISGLQKIDRSLYEAADIDGANGWQKLWTITFPLIKSIILIACLFTIMQVTTINIASVGTINNWITWHIDQGNYAVAALGAWVQTIIVLIFVLIAFLLFREKEFVVKQKSFEEMEAYKKKKEIRRAKVAAFFHVAEIGHFFAKLFSPITTLVNVSKEKARLRKEERGDK